MVLVATGLTMLYAFRGKMVRSGSLAYIRSYPKSFEAAGVREKHLTLRRSSLSH
jgi:hypothetical protein